MNPDYTTAMMMSDVMNVIAQNAPPVIQVAIFVGVVNFVIGWFMSSISMIAKAGRQ